LSLREKGDFRQKIWAVLPFGDFLPKKREAVVDTGSYHITHLRA
jgi:hypothetical protein